MSRSERPPKRAESPLGRYAGPDSVVIRRTMPGPVERVWSYLTNPRDMARWLAGAELDLRKGGIIALDFDEIICPGREEMGGTMSGTITVYEPPHRLAYTWNERGHDATAAAAAIVTFELVSLSDNDTQLTLTHTRIPRDEMSGIAAGWHVHLDVLASRLLGREPASFRDAYTVLERQYHARLG